MKMKTRGADFISRHREAVAFLALYVVLFGAWNLSGGSFKVWQDLWQLLPWPSLLDDLGRSLLDLHAQPPFLNLVFGAALKASVLMGTTVETLLQPLYFVLGAFTVVSLTAVAIAIIPRSGVRRVVLLLVLSNPYFYAVHHVLFYTAWECFFLSLTALLSLRYFEHRSAARLVTALAPAVLLVYTRSLFHPLWFVLLLAMMLTLGRPIPPGSWKRFSVVCAVALLLIAAWPLKNLTRFGFFGLSSWSGFSISRGLLAGDLLLNSGYPLLVAFCRDRSSSVDPLDAAVAQSLVPSEFRGHPTLSELTKPDGSPNWNHYAIIPLSSRLGNAALERVRREPSLLFFKAVDFYLNGYAIYEARWPYERGFSPDMTTGSAWASLYELVVFQRFRPYDPGRTGVTTGFAVLFPIILVTTGIVLCRRRPWGAAERTIVVMLFTILWVLAMVVFVDGAEGNRIRFSTEPYLFLVIGWLVGNRPAKGAQAPPAPEEDRLQFRTKGAA